MSKRKWTRHPAVQIGDQYGRLTVVEEGPKNKLGKTWWCVCDCDRLMVLDHPVNDAHLKNGNTQSCGCRQKDAARGHRFKHGESPAKGKKPSRTYACWRSMLHRCTNPANSEWCNYGGRNPNPVTVCARWKTNYLDFKSDMGGPCPDGYEIDRKKNANGYWCGRPECLECGPLGREPNCHWVPGAENNRNRDDVRKYPFEGQMLTTGQLSELTGGRVRPSCILYRIEVRKWSPERAMNTPVKPRRPPTFRRTY